MPALENRVVFQSNLFLGLLYFIIYTNAKEFCSEWEWQYCEEAQAYNLFMKNKFNAAILGLNRCLDEKLNYSNGNGLKLNKKFDYYLL